jgi:UDP-glucose 4-epimerase
VEFLHYLRQETRGDPGGSVTSEVAVVAGSEADTVDKLGAGWPVRADDAGEVDDLDRIGMPYLSSSMVFESAHSRPSYGGQEHDIPPPVSSYGFQKLAVEYFARAANDQYGLPFTIVRPFNCVGVGEMRAKTDEEVLSGNVKLAMSHVVPDLVQKVAKGQDPLHILGNGSQVRHYTYGADLAHGIVTAMEHPRALNEDFNLSTRQSTTVLELAENIWHRVRGAQPFRHACDEPFEHDVQCRIPAVDKARDMLGFEATTSLDEMLDIVVPWVLDAIGQGLI